MRWFEPHWRQLKSTGRLELISDYSEHPHVLKGIRKEAGRDVGFKHLCADENKSFRICSKREAKKLTIYLEWKDVTNQSRTVS